MTNPDLRGGSGSSTAQALALKLWVVLARAHASVEAHLQANVAAHGLTLTEFGILEVLFHKGPLLLGEVQRRILVSSGGITYLVDRLEKKGLVERRECPEDRRARYAALTPAGEELIARIFPEHASCIEALMEVLGEEEQRTAVDLLRALGRSAAEQPRPACDPEEPSFVRLNLTTEETGAAMLTFIQSVPDHAPDGSRVLVLLHGRGSDENDLMALRPHLPPDLVLVCPRAPFPGAPWGYGPGWAWYRFLGGSRPEPESFDASQRALRELLDALPELLPVVPGKVTVGGFSQGGTMSLAFALRDPGVVSGVLNFSGFLADHPSVEATADTVRGTRFFWGHGTHDPSIPFALAREGRAALAAAGAELTAREYPIGHWIAPEELRDASSWMNELTPHPSSEERR